MKRIISKLVALGMVCCLSVAFASISFAGEWKKNSIGWWYVNDDGTYPTNSWSQINGEWYYFYETGYMACNTTTPDGYWVGSDGAWIQAKEAGVNEANYIDNEEMDMNIDEYRDALYEASTRSERKEAVLKYLEAFDYDVDYLVIEKNKIKYNPPIAVGYNWVGEDEPEKTEFTNDILSAVLKYVNAEGQLYGYYKRIGDTDEFEYLEKRDAVEVYAEKLIELVEG